MLLGCCHCGETPPSESASQSLGSEDSVASNEISTDLSLCVPCLAVPRSFLVTLAGWSGLFAAHDSCCGSINGSYSITADVLANYSGGGVTAFSLCNFWKSAEKCKNHNSATTVAPTCALDATRPLVEMVSIMKTIGSTTMRYALTVWSIVPGGFGGTFWPWVFEGNDIGGDLTKCLYPTLNTTTNTPSPNARCSPGTVTLTPL